MRIRGRRHARPFETFDACSRRSTRCRRFHLARSRSTSPPSGTPAAAGALHRRARICPEGPIVPRRVLRRAFCGRVHLRCGSMQDPGALWAPLVRLQQCALPAVRMTAEGKEPIMKPARPMLLVAAVAASVMLAASPSWAFRPCRTIAGPVNQGVYFFGVRCNYVACYCQRRVCPPPFGIRTWCTRLQMKFH